MARLPRCFAALLALLPLALPGQAARFDLPGPTVDIRVTRAGVSLPIASVPNLQAGDLLFLHPAFPDTQSAHYLLIAAFLRGTTNPPPDGWFTRIETWNHKIREEGVTVTVPEGAQQAILFLAPETSGDFGTLRSAVQGRPGVFVRASQDLTEAGFEQSRVDAYLEAMKHVPPADAAGLVEHSNLLARTLNLRPNPDCVKRPLDQQYNCLTQTGAQTLLDDGHAQTIVASLSSGPGSDFINAASNTRLAAGGNYSAYVGALVDLARLMNGLHTAQYQYIPALATPAGEALNLRLNTPPSFHNPKSVLVIGLPAIQSALPPPLRPAEGTQIACLLDPKLVLPLTGAPLVFTTDFAHNLVLHLNVPPSDAHFEAPKGYVPPPGGYPQQDLPLTPDAFQGGLTLAPALTARKNLALLPTPNLGTAPSTPPPAPPAGVPGQTITGTIEGFWGFDRFTGPTVQLQGTPGEGWHIVPSEARDLIAGQPNHLQLLSTGTACIQSIHLEPGGSKVDFKLAAGSVPAVPAPVDLALNLQHAETPGSIRLAIQQFGRPGPDPLGTKSFAEPAKIASLRLHAGDLAATLTGTSLDQVQSLTFQTLTYLPAAEPADGALQLVSPKALALKASEKVTAQVHLKDGRTLESSTLVLPPRPTVTLLSRRVTEAPASPIQLSSPSILPLGAKLMFFLKSEAAFPRAEQIEIANADESLHTTLSVLAGTLVLQDSHTVLATLDPLKAFGPSTFGPFRLRAVGADNTPGDWLPLATIVRLPVLTSLSCPAAAATESPCTLAGENLFLLASVAPTLAYVNPTAVPEGFVDSTLPLARPASSTFFLKLRDDPETAQPVSLPITRQ